MFTNRFDNILNQQAKVTLKLEIGKCTEIKEEK